MPEAATGLSEAREAAGAIAELWIACFCEACFVFVSFLKHLSSPLDFEEIWKN